MRALLLALLLFAFASPAMADIDALKAEANQAAADGQIDTAIAKFRELLVELPDDGPTHYRLGTLLMDNGGDINDAIQHFTRAGELGFQPGGVAYRLSRIYARSGRKTEALSQIESMAASGFSLPGLINNQPDYDSIRTEARFTAALATITAARFPCQADERHKAFDFWIGKWNVTQNGQFAGTNNIQPIMGHCAIFEQWESANGGIGKSFNYYDPGYDHWRQIWISDSGTFIEFVGEARDGGIFYTAETVNPADGSVTHHKFEFTQNGDGSVRQYWQTSTDGGETWSSIWDGHYVRQAEAEK